MNLSAYIRVSLFFQTHRNGPDGIANPGLAAWAGVQCWTGFAIPSAMFRLTGTGLQIPSGLGVRVFADYNGFRNMPCPWT